MAHSDPEILSLMALGERVGTAEDDGHLQTCRSCRDELSELRHLVELGRGVENLAISVPDSAVWDRIRDELALEVAVGGSVTASPDLSLRAVMEAALAGSSGSPNDDGVFRATLAPVPGRRPGPSGEAVLAVDRLGRRILQVALHPDSPSRGLRRARLVRRGGETDRIVLGVLDGPYGVWTVDRSIDLDHYATLEVVQQGEDASGRDDVIVRGQLAAVA